MTIKRLEQLDVVIAHPARPPPLPGAERGQ